MADPVVPDVSDVVARIMAESEAAAAATPAEFTNDHNGNPEYAPAAAPAMTEPLSPLDLALAELADSFVPHPDDFLESYTPQAAFLFGRQVAMKCLEIATGAAISLGVESDEEVPTVTEVLNGVSMAVAGLTHALVALGVLPPEAEEALTVGKDAS